MSSVRKKGRRGTRRQKEAAAAAATFDQASSSSPGSDPRVPNRLRLRIRGWSLAQIPHKSGLLARLRGSLHGRNQGDGVGGCPSRSRRRSVSRQGVAIAIYPDSGKEAHVEGLGGRKEALCSSSHSVYFVS